jgi:hypothetical protein
MNVDMQVLIPKVSDVARLQNDQQHSNLARHTEFAQQIQEQANKLSQTVVQPNKEEDVHIQDKQERERRRKKQNQPEEDEDQETPRPKSGSSILVPKVPHKIDIKI